MKFRHTVNQAAESLGVLLFLASIAGVVMLAAMLCEKQSCEIRPSLPGPATARALAAARAPGAGAFSPNHPDRIAALLARN
jgi:hypothetical protein